MLARRVSQPARLLWLALALLALPASPDAARADCGDHARPTATALDLGLASFVPFDGPKDIPSPPRPCTGPSCSQGRPAAPTAVLTAPRIAPERGLVALRIDPRRTDGVRPDLARRQPAYEPPSLDRPDRPPRL